MSGHVASHHFPVPRPPRSDVEFSLKLLHTEDRRYLLWALVGALVVHLVVLFVPLPDLRQAFKPEKTTKVVYVRKYIPPPPPVERKQIVQKKIVRKVAIPDPTPDEPEPIREPEPEIAPIAIEDDVEYLIGEPEPPPAPKETPLLAGVGDVSLPERIEESHVQPVYPEIARKARIESRLLLQAVILKDGTVAEIEVLQARHPGLGFEEAAIDAVRQWRYKPALQDGKPVDVYFTIVVQFTLQ